MEFKFCRDIFKGNRIGVISLLIIELSFLNNYFYIGFNILFNIIIIYSDKSK